MLALAAYHPDSEGATRSPTMKLCPGEVTVYKLDPPIPPARSFSLNLVSEEALFLSFISTPTSGNIFRVVSKLMGSAIITVPVYILPVPSTKSNSSKRGDPPLEYTTLYR